MGKDLSPFQIDVCARAAHEVNRSYSMMLQDLSHLSWDATSEPDKQVVRSAVIGIVANDHDAERSHEAWVAAKLAQGWKWDTTKDLEKKTHPCLVRWSSLPMELQIKDELFVTTVHSIVGSLWRIPQ